MESIKLTADRVAAIGLAATAAFADNQCKPPDRPFPDSGAFKSPGGGRFRRYTAQDARAKAKKVAKRRRAKGYR